MQRLAEFLQDPDGRLSSNRIIYIAWSLSVLIVWTGASIYQGALAEIPTSVASVLGVLTGAKVLQRFGEPS